jgi:putative DNA-invertase from lambdoid prophage Rac
MQRHSWDEPPIIRAGIYARVSTEDQHCEIQLQNLREFIKRSGWPAATEYLEKLSGKEGSKRPQLERLMAHARLRELDVVVVWKLDRFGRSTIDTLHNVRTLSSYNVRFLCPQMGIDTDNKNAVGQFVLTIFAAIAELERSFILERTAAGFRAYRAAHGAGTIGTTRHSKSGKDLPVGRPRNVFPRDRALERLNYPQEKDEGRSKLRNAGMSWRKIAAQLGVPQSTIRLALKAQ